MVEGARLESVYAGNRIAGSNPVLSARKIYPMALWSYDIFFSQKNRILSHIENTPFGVPSIPEEAAPFKGWLCYTYRARRDRPATGLHDVVTAATAKMMAS